jgi:hypothetical protein
MTIRIVGKPLKALKVYVFFERRFVSCPEDGAKKYLHFSSSKVRKYLKRIEMYIFLLKIYFYSNLNESVK